MPGKIFLLLFIIYFLLFIRPIPIDAQTSTPSQPTPTIQPTCDLCGWCPPITTVPKPPSWQECSDCLYVSGIPQQHSYYTVLGCFSTRSGEFVQKILTIVFGMAGGIAFLTVLFGSAMVLTSSGDPEKLQSGKDMVTSSIFGLLLIIFSVFLLKVVGLDILGIPGFG